MIKEGKVLVQIWAALLGVSVFVCFVYRLPLMV